MVIQLLAKIVYTLIELLIAWLFIVKIPAWLKLKSFIAFIVKVIGVVILIYALLSIPSWFNP